MVAEPQLLANIGDGGASRQRSGTAFTLSRQGKRKRCELVLGTGSGVQVVDAKARTSRSVTSYGLPPGESLLCDPVSVVVRGADGTKERFTYWATDAGHAASSLGGSVGKVKVTCLRESGNDSRTTTTTLGSAKEPASSIRCVEIVQPTADDDDEEHLAPSHEVLAVHVDGGLTSFSADLQTSGRKARLPLQDVFGRPGTSDHSLQISVRFATSFTLDQTREYLLKGRPDVAASWRGRQGTVLACVISDTQHRLHLCYFHLGPQPTEILTNPLYTSVVPYSSTTEFVLSLKGSRLYVMGEEDTFILETWDLTQQHVTCDASMRIPPAVTMLPLSKYRIAASHQDHIAVYDVKWHSLQATLQTPAIEGGSRGPQLLSYFSTLGTMAVAAGESLLSYNLSDETDKDSRSAKRHQTGGLADAVGNGLRQRSSATTESNDRPKTLANLGKLLIPSSGNGAAKEIKKSFDPLLEQNNLQRYDEAMLRTLQAVSGNKNSGSIGYAAQPELIAYSISGLFTASSQGADRIAHLRVRKLAPETFRFLLTKGLLTRSQIEKSLRSQGQLDARQRLQESAIVDALSEHDETLQALIYYLSSAPILSAYELTSSLLVCLKTVQKFASRSTIPAVEGTLPLTIGDGHKSDDQADTVMTNGVADPDQSTTAFDGEWPDPDPEEGLSHNARSALGACLTRLSICHAKEVQTAFRAVMSTAEVLTLIDYIRMELSSGGWLARHLDEDLEGEGDLSSQTSQITVAAKVLNFAIDSLGPTTWLLGTGAEVEASRSADKVAYLQAEINAALEGIENSAFLEQTLHEVLLHAKTAESTRRHKPTSSGIIELPTAAESKEAQMLPLGMKRDTVSQTKTSAGGKDKARSRRDKADLKSRKVPEYSFERIVV